MDVTAMLQGVNLRPPWNEYLNTYISLCDNVINTKHSLSDPFLQLRVIHLVSILALLDTSTTLVKLLRLNST